MPQLRRHRMRRPARLDSARAWLDSGAQPTVRSYARRYGVDRYTAFDELTMLGVTLPAKDEQWSVRPPPVPKRAKRSRSHESGQVGDGLPDDWIEWGGELIFVVGFTSGGAPFGLRVDEFPAEDLPEELKGWADPGGAVVDEPSSRHAVRRKGPDREAEDDWDVPF